MVQPIDYTTQVLNPFQAALQGVQAGVGLQNVQAQREAAQVKMLQQQQEMQRQQVLGEAMRGLTDKIRAGTAGQSDFQQIALLAPKDQSEAALKIWESMDKARQQGILSFGSQVMSALGSKNPQIGIDLLKERAAAERDTGNVEQARAYDTWARLAELDPANSQATIGGLLQGLPGGDKAIEAWTKVQQERRAAELQPSALTESQAKAQKAAVEAKFAESNAAIDLQKKGWDITKIQEDIKIARQNSNIAALNAQIAREANQIRREGQNAEQNLRLQELGLKLQEMQSKRDASVREKAADLEAARGNVDNMLNTAQRILNTPMGVVGSAAGPISSRVPTLSQDTANFEELVSTLGSQSFLAQIPNIKGMGALSNAEGEKLQAALQNFSLRQSPERLMENVKEAQRLLMKARKNMTDRSGLPDSPPDIPAASVSVTAPNGQVLTFPSQQAADAFKKAAGIR